MRKLTYIIISLISVSIICGCKQSTSRHEASLSTDPASSTDVIDSIESVSITSRTQESGIDGVDSLLTYIYNLGGNELKLFSIAKGGNIECIGDSILHIDGKEMVLFTLADYSQEDQIFYILFNRENEEFVQSERINLAMFDKTIADYRSLTIGNLSCDSIRIIVPDKNTKLSFEVLKLDCDSNKIINYYEYE